MHDAPDPETPPAAEPDVIRRWLAAVKAAGNAATVGLGVAILAVIWIIMANLATTLQADRLQTQPNAEAAWTAKLIPLVIDPDYAIAMPAALGFAVALFGPFLIAVAAWRVRRTLKQAPDRARSALAVLLGCCAVSVLPGLMIHLNYEVRWHDETSGGMSSHGGGPAPMCGALLLIVAAYAGFALLRYGPTLQEGPPPGLEAQQGE